MKSIGPFLISFLFLFDCHRPTEGDLLIQNVNVIDVETGEIDSNQDVLIIGDSIASIEVHEQFKYAAYETVDGTDKFLIPGLWDMHTHTWWAYEDFFPMLLANGITGIREMFGNRVAIPKIKSEIALGNIIGPDFVSPGLIIDGKPAIQPGSDEASSPEEGRKIVRRQKQEGADFIKVYSRLERETYFAIADECRIQNIPMVGHIPNKVTLEEAIQANHGSIEHFLGIDAYCHSQYSTLSEQLRSGLPQISIPPSTVAIMRDFGINDPEKFGIASLSYDPDQFDEDRIPQLVELLSSNNSWITPTMIIGKGEYYSRYDADYDPSFLNSYMPDHTIENYYVKDTLKTKRDSIRSNNDKKFYEFKLKVLKQLFDGGAKILAGSDYPMRFCYPGFSLHDELQIFVEDVGATRLQALQTATINPAIFLKLDHELGTVELGKRANLLLLAYNPLKDIKNTRRIDGIVLQGKFYSSGTLKTSLELIAEKQGRPKIKDVIKPIIQERGIDSAIEKYLELKSNNPNDYNFNEYQLITLGNSLLKSENALDALKILELNTTMFPNYMFAFESLAEGYILLGEKAKARMAWQKAVELGFQASQDKLESLKNEE